MISKLLPTISLEKWLQKTIEYQPQLSTSIDRDATDVVNLDDIVVWVQACEQCVALFKRIMPMAMENLTIA